MVISQEQITASIVPQYETILLRSLYEIKDRYPGGNTDLLGRQLITHLGLRTEKSGILNGVLYNVIGKMKGTDTLTFYVLQPNTDTITFDIDLTVLDTQFTTLRDKEWK